MNNFLPSSLGTNKKEYAVEKGHFYMTQKTYPSISAMKWAVGSNNVGLKITWHGQVGIWSDAILLKVSRYGKREE